jgi:hypothetical protein
MHLGLVVEGEELEPGTCFFGKGRAPRTCCWKRRLVVWNLCCGVLSMTTHPQQYREFQPRQARNRRYCNVYVPDGSCNFDSLLGRHVPNSTRSYWIGRSKTSVAAVQVSSLSSDWAILLFTLSLGRIWSLTRNSLSVRGGLVFDRRFTCSGRRRVCQGKVGRTPKSGAHPVSPDWLKEAFSEFWGVPKRGALVDILNFDIELTDSAYSVRYCDKT